MFIKKDTIDDLLRVSHQEILKNGVRGTSSRGSYIALQGVLLEVSNPLARLSRSKSRGKIVSCLGELIWILAGSNSLASIAPYISQYVDESEDGSTIHGAYGPRLFGEGDYNQFDRVVSLLGKKQSTRRAVLQIFDRADLTKDHKEVPCTLTMQFRVIAGALNMIVNMRSNDAFWGLPHDVFVFTMLQEIMANRLNLPIGSYKHFAGDLHIYSKHEKKVRRFIDEGWFTTKSEMPEMPKDDLEKSINFLISSEAKLRNHEPIVIPEFLKPYWSNLIGFIGAHHEREHNPELLKQYTDMINFPFYKVFKKDRDLNE